MVDLRSRLAVALIAAIIAVAEFPSTVQAVRDVRE